ncbi:MAG: hypothetical protein ACR2P8_12660 [Myxococcota bacterium]
MADPNAEKPSEEEEGPARTPFDNPFFLPVMLWLFTAWFGWDAWIVPMEEHLAFNRYGFFVVLALALWFTWRAIKEKRAESESEPSD